MHDSDRSILGHWSRLLALLMLACSACESEPELPACGYDLKNDREHCGACERACERDDMCLDGACVADRNWALWPVPPQPLTESLYTVSDDTVIDEVTSLEWQREVDRPVADEEAKGYCEDLALAGGGDSAVADSDRALDDCGPHGSSAGHEYVCVPRYAQRGLQA